MKYLDGLTASQKSAVLTRDNLTVVSAAAGSGKTRVLVSKILHEVLENRIPLSRIVAITYTNKAADQMKSRLIRAFTEVRRADLAREVHTASIMTIHSFCLSLLKTYAIDAGLDPDFGVLEDIENERIVTSGIQQVLSDFLKREKSAADPIFEFANYSQLAKALRSAFEEWSTSSESPKVKTFDEDDINCAYSEFRDELQKFKKRYPDWKTDIPPADSRAHSGGWGDKRSEIQQLLNQPGFNLNRVKKDFREEADYLRNKGREIIGLCAEMESAGIKEIMLRLLLDLGERIKLAKANLNQISVDDQLNLMFRLTGNSDVLEELQERFSWIMVDEFQDINSVQHDFITRLGAKCRKFYVGDVRQSIYSFRHADCSIFAELIREDGGHTVIHLDENFRSTKSVLDSVNKVFDKEDCAPGLPFGRVDAFRQDSSTAASIQIFRQNRPSTPLEYKLQEAGIIAGQVADIRGENPAARIAILLKSMASAYFYSEALNAKGISSRVLGSGGFYESDEVMDFLNLLTWIHDRGNDIALASLLKSPWVGLSDDALCFIRIHGGVLGEAVCDAEMSGLAASDRIVLQHFRKWAGESASRLKDLGLSGFCDWTADFFLIRQTYLQLSSPVIRTGNLEKFLHFVRSFSESGNLGHFLESSHALAASGSVSESEYYPEEENSSDIEIMSIHRSKGLEFQYVFMADIESRTQVDAGLVFQLNRKGEVVVSVPDDDADERIKTYSYEKYADEKKLLREQESLRLFYVAMTRAEEGLRIFGHKPDTKSAPDAETLPVHSILRLSSMFGETVLPDCTYDHLPVFSDRSMASGKYMIQELKDYLTSGTETQSSMAENIRLQPSGYAESRVLTVTALIHNPEPSVQIRSDGDPIIISEASDFGDAFHEAMQHYDYSAPADRQVRVLADQFGGSIDIRLQSRLEDEISRFEKSELYKTVRRSHLAGRTVLREFPFMLRIPGVERGALIRGVVDLMWVNEDGSWSIADYKTGEKYSDHEDQLLAYMFCLEELCNMRFDYACIYYSRTGESAPLELSRLRSGEFRRILLEKYRNLSHHMIQSPNDKRTLSTAA